MPKDEDVTFVGGGAKVGWLNRFVNVLSRRIRIRSVRWKVLDNPAAIVAVPGPCRIPTPQFPTGPSGIGLNKAMLNMLPVAALATLPMRSARCKLPRKESLRLPGSKLELVVGVRYGPVSQRLTVLTDHPPSARSEIRFRCERNFRSDRHIVHREEQERLRRVPPYCRDSPKDRSGWPPRCPRAVRRQ